MNKLCTLVDIVLVYPREFITIPGGRASYTCTASDNSPDFVQSVQWLINDTLLENLELRNVTVTSTEKLRFSMITTNYNNTNIKCNATLSSGIASISTEGTLLQVQGMFF